MTLEQPQQANEETRAAWNQNAAFWDERMGEGNDFVEVLVWPITERLLELRGGERVLDIACGNGLTSRHLAVLGAEVTAFDFAEEMIVHARKRLCGGQDSHWAFCLPQVALRSGSFVS